MARRVGKLAAKGFALTDREHRRYTDRQGREVSYREAFLRATGRSLEKASAAHAGKFTRTTTVAKEIRTAARDGLLSKAKLLSASEERRLRERTLKSLMRGHTFGSALSRGTSSAKTEGISSVERRSAFGKLLGILHEGESGGGLVRRRPKETRASFENRRRLFETQRQRLRTSNPREYRRLFGATSRKAKLLVAMGRREANATYDVGETP